MLRTVPDADALRRLVDGGARRAVLVGAGFIGLEVAEALRHRGLDVTVIELAGQVLPALDPEMARSVELELRRAGVDVRVSTTVTGFRETAGGGTLVDLSDGSALGADLVLLATGVRPETTLAAAAGLDLSRRGALLVDDQLRTSDPSIYGVGDAIEAVDAVCGTPLSVPLAGPASRQGRAVADHLFGKRRAPGAGAGHRDRARLRHGGHHDGPQREGAAGRRGSPARPCTCTRTSTRATTPGPARCT